MSNIHIATKDGGRFEYDLDELETLWREGAIDPSALYWQSGMSEWMPASELFEETQTGPDALAAYRYQKDPGGLTRFLLLMLWVSLGMEVVSIIGELMQLDLFDRIYTVTVAEAEANDLRQGIIGITYLIVFIVTGVTFLKWLYRANLNSHGFGADGMQFTPGWSVGYYFIPIANFFRPYQAMREIFQVSENPKDWRDRKVPAIVGWWWAFWLISCFLGQLLFRMPMDSDNLQDYKNASYMAIYSSLVGVVLCLLAIQIVKRTFRNQEALVRG